MAQAQELDVGRQRLLLRLPVLVSHRITEDSPLRAWRAGLAALAADANSEIVVVVCSGSSFLSSSSSSSQQATPQQGCLRV